MKTRDYLIKACLFRAQHRGSREADMIIGGFAEKELHTLTETQLSYFAEMLSWDDEDIFAWMKVCQTDENHTLRQALLAFQDKVRTPL